MNNPIPGRSITCDRCGCQPIIEGNARHCPAGGNCLGLSESSDDGSTRRQIDNPNHTVVGALGAGIKPPEGAAQPLPVAAPVTKMGEPESTQ